MSKSLSAHVDVREFAPHDENEEQSAEEEEEENSFQVSTNLSNTFGYVMLATAMIYVSAGENAKAIQIRALLDQGSQASFVSENVVQQLRLRKEKITASVSSVGQEKTKKIKHAVHFNIQSLNKKFDLKMGAMVIKNVTAIRGVPNLAKRNWKHIQGLSLADPHYDQAGCIDMLIGADVFGVLLREGLKKGNQNDPIAQFTELGWVLSGCTGDQFNKTIISAHVSLDQLVKKFWDTEEAPYDTAKTGEDICAEEHFVQNHRRDASGRYMVRLPFKNNERPHFLDTRKKALRRAIQAESSMKKKPEFQAEYNACIQEYLDLGHMQLSEIQGKNDNDGFFMAHYPVIKESSKTTRVRPVFDASGKDASGVSLNDKLMVGPTIQPKLSAVLQNWRRYEFVVTTDGQRMKRASSRMLHRKYWYPVTWTIFSWARTHQWS